MRYQLSAREIPRAAGGPGARRDTALSKEIIGYQVNLGGGTASRSPFQRSLRSLPPFLGRGMKPRPATKGAYPLGIPDDRFPAASRGAYEPIVILESWRDLKATLSSELKKAK